MADWVTSYTVEERSVQHRQYQSQPLNTILSQFSPLSVTFLQIPMSSSHPLCFQSAIFVDFSQKPAPHAIKQSVNLYEILFS